MRLRVGTSGFAYKEWKGSFYPKELKDAGFLSFYAARFDTVEINNTFYRMPKPELLAGWASQVGDDFAFVLKAPQKITHIRRLKPECGPDLLFFTETARTLGPRLGPILVQTPPNLKLDLERFDGFLALLPNDLRFAFEFRNPTWFDEAVHARLRAGGHVLVASDTDESGDEGAPLVATAPWAYLRLRRAGYDDDALRGWHERLRALGALEAWVFFKHEDAGTGPQLARRFLELR
ncbi:MAG: DUF72 domain-containing protein [Vicinamibacteria bacterium]|nr:DUF72 domain-containing protein [Vicinamibacteria bacterium]